MGWNGPNYASFWMLDVESNNFSHAEKKRAACKAAEQIHKMTTIFTKNGPRLSFGKLEKNHMTQLATAKTKTRGHVEHHSWYTRVQNVCPG